MKILGIHLLLDLEKCDPDKLDDLQGIENLLTRAAKDAGAKIVGKLSTDSTRWESQVLSQSRNPTYPYILGLNTIMPLQTYSPVEKTSIYTQLQIF